MWCIALGKYNSNVPSKLVFSQIHILHKIWFIFFSLKLILPSLSAMPKIQVAFHHFDLCNNVPWCFLVGTRPPSLYLITKSLTGIKISLLITLIINFLVKFTRPAVDMNQWDYAPNQPGLKAGQMAFLAPLHQTVSPEQPANLSSVLIPLEILKSKAPSIR